MSMPKLIPISVFSTLLAACGGGGVDYAGGTPDVAGLTLETTGGGSEGLPGALAVPGQVSAAATAPCEDWQYLCKIHEGVSGLNLFVRATVEPVEQLVALAPSKPAENVRVFGPADLAVWGQAAPVATFRLTVVLVRDGVFRWRLDAKPVGAPDPSYLPVLAGELARGELRHRGRGVLGIDLDALRAANPAVFTGQGKLLAAFGHAGPHKALAYALLDFQAFATSPFIPSAVFVGHKWAGGPARVRLATWNEFLPDQAGGPDAGLELLLARGGWWPGLGGRAAVAVTGGDVPSYGVPGFAVDFFLAVSCYDAVESEVYRDLFACSHTDVWTVPGPWQGRHCVPVPLPAGDPRRYGTPGACVVGTDLYDDQNPPPPTGDTSGELEPGAPTSAGAPPAGMPGP